MEKSETASTRYQHMKRIISSFLIVLGIGLLARAAYDEARGRTHKPLQILQRPFNSPYLYRIPVDRARNPELFRQFMTTRWIYACFISGAGCALYIAGKPSKNE